MRGTDGMRGYETVCDTGGVDELGMLSIMPSSSKEGLT